MNTSINNYNHIDQLNSDIEDLIKCHFRFNEQTTIQKILIKNKTFVTYTGPECKNKYVANIREYAKISHLEICNYYRKIQIKEINKHIKKVAIHDNTSDILRGINKRSNNDKNTIKIIIAHFDPTNKKENDIIIAGKNYINDVDNSNKRKHDEM